MVGFKAWRLSRFTPKYIKPCEQVVNQHTGATTHSDPPDRLPGYKLNIVNQQCITHVVDHAATEHQAKIAGKLLKNGQARGPFAKGKVAIQKSGGQYRTDKREQATIVQPQGCFEQVEDT